MKRGRGRVLSDQDIRACFNATFFSQFNVLMEGGAAEPFYHPAQCDQPARLCYREDYAASALHEAAHWCLAGARRRRLADFGYWYVPTPRATEQQAAFLDAEAPVQALELHFAEAAGVPFNVSVDDVDADEAVRRQFEQRVQALAGAQSSVNSLATRFMTALRHVRVDG